MPNKKRLFTRHNSTKFLLYTDGRDEEGNKITENVLVPVTENHIPGNSLIISRIAELYAKPNESKTIKKPKEKDNLRQHSKRKSSASTSTDNEPNLRDILDQMGDISEDEDEYENVKAKFKNMGFLENLGSSEYSPSNIQIDFEEDCDFLEELSQFCDAESDSSENFDFDDFRHKNALTSSKPNCPQNIEMLNDGFDKIFEEYDENQIGALDDEEICGVFSTENEQIQNFIQTPMRKIEENGELDDALRERILQYTETDEVEKLVEISIERPLEFDCESIISTYSNKYNHPTIIREESSKIKKIRIPNNPLQKTLTKSKLKQLDTVSESDEESDDMSVATTMNIRSKDETPEQRRERKNLFKEAKRERRRLKKENKLAYKMEMNKQITQAINAQNNSGMRLI